MKKIIALVLATLMVLSCAAFADEAKTLIMDTHATFPPYEYYEGEQVVGIDAEIAAAICEKLGYTLVINDTEFGSIISDVQTGKADFGMAGMTVTEERLQQISFTTPYAQGVQVIIVNEGSSVASVEDLAKEGLNIAVQQSTTGDIYISGEFTSANIMRFPKAADAVEALKTGKADCVVIDNEPAKAFVAANEGLVILETAYTVEDYAICIAQENVDLLEDFNAALAELTEDGTIAAILEKYIPTSTTETAE